MKFTTADIIKCVLCYLRGEVGGWVQGITENYKNAHKIRDNVNFFLCCVTILSHNMKNVNYVRGINCLTNFPTYIIKSAQRYDFWVPHRK
jgi:hypothetical protein